MVLYRMDGTSGMKDGGREGEGGSRMRRRGERWRREEGGRGEGSKVLVRA
jgi:hypothetical protein